MDELWICQDCFLLEETGELNDVSEVREEDVAEAIASLSGYLAANWDSETGEGINEFSWSTCDCCRSRLGGERHRYTLTPKGA